MRRDGEAMNGAVALLAAQVHVLLAVRSCLRQGCAQGNRQWAAARNGGPPAMAGPSGQSGSAGGGGGQPASLALPIGIKAHLDCPAVISGQRGAPAQRSGHSARWRCCW